MEVFEFKLNGKWQTIVAEKADIIRLKNEYENLRFAPTWSTLEMLKIRGTKYWTIPTLEKYLESSTKK